jgi:hypothetical protein
MRTFKKNFLCIAILLLLLLSDAFGNHFITTWSGSALYPMTIFVKDAKIDGDALQAGDEIGVFDGTICVGSFVIAQPIDPTQPDTYIQIVVSEDDGSGNGYISGHTITYRYWLNQKEIEVFEIEAQYISQPPPYNLSTFASGETTVAELSGSSVTRALDLRKQDLLKIYPNPGKDLLHISFNDGEESGKIQIINHAGQVVYVSYFESIQPNELRSIHLENLQNGHYILIFKEKNRLPIFNDLVILN